MNLPRHRNGYVFLVSVLAVGVIVCAAVLSLLLLGWAAGQNSLALIQSSQAFENAQTCAEQAILNLRGDFSYAGSGSAVLTQGSCKVYTIKGDGNLARTICVEGTVGTTKRRLEITINHILPSTVISDWKEVNAITLCQ